MLIKLIDKSALVAEIEKAIKIIYAGREYVGIPYGEECIVSGLQKAEDIINTLEVKEVDLDTEQRQYLTKHFNVYDDGVLQSKKSGLPLRTYDIIKVAEHFFELGMGVSNPVTAADRGTAEEIILSLRQVENDYRIDHTKEIEWVRSKVQKGE